MGFGRSICHGHGAFGGCGGRARFETGVRTRDRYFWRWKGGKCNVTQRLSHPFLDRWGCRGGGQARGLKKGWGQMRGGETSDGVIQEATGVGGGTSALGFGRADSFMMGIVGGELDVG